MVRVSDDADAPVSVEPTEIAQYAGKMAELEELIDTIDYKIEGDGRIVSPEKARARQGYMRLKIKAIDQWRKLRREHDIDELREKVDNLADEVDGGR